MAYAVELAMDAERDLEDIHGYVAGRDSQEVADRLLDRLEEACAELSSLPGRGTVPVELRDLGITEFREIHPSPYRVIYRIFEVDRRIVVYGVFDGRRDMQTQLRHRLLRP